jgi:hypothetical protein
MSAWGKRHRARYGTVASRSKKATNSADRIESLAAPAAVVQQMSRLTVAAKPFGEKAAL